MLWGSWLLPKERDKPKQFISPNCRSFSFGKEGVQTHLNPYKYHFLTCPKKYLLHIPPANPAEILTNISNTKKESTITSTSFHSKIFHLDIPYLIHWSLLKKNFKTPWWNCWWFRNLAITSWGKGSLSHYLQGFSTIPGGLEMGFLKHQQKVTTFWRLWKPTTLVFLVVFFGNPLKRAPLWPSTLLMAFWGDLYDRW